ncbi:MAG: ORF6N domain-containing protein [Candidatus Delongbacteria bacterium]|nr:ORF6N domain-containing protein [Candidatus Delongbacteria bacterium]
MQKNEIEKFNELDIKDKIYSIRGYQVMLDSNLAELYEVETRILNQAVKRNKGRFPLEFCFQLNSREIKSLRSQIVISNKAKSSLRSQFATAKKGGARYLPYAFTEQGVAMLSAVLRSDTAIEISVKIMSAFVEMRKFINSNAQIFQRLDRVELKQIETDSRIDRVFSALENEDNIPKQRIFFDGQIFDAHKFVSDLFSNVKKSIVIIDNYIDVTVLSYLSQLQKNTKVKIITKSISESMKFDIEKFEKQYFPIEIKIFKQSHDRFVIIDNKDVYHIGASLKDLGKKWFAFTKMEKVALDILNKIEEI